MRTLIVNADDFGLNQAATDGILECYRAGSVTSTTLMANAPDCVRAASLAAGHPSLGVGLHFNLTWGRPLNEPSRVPALLDRQGQFLSRSELATRLMLGRVPRLQLDRELEAQLDRLQQLGVAITHVDSHQHVHAFPQVFSSIARFCSDQGLPMRVPWVAVDRNAGFARRVRRATLAALVATSTRRWRGRVRWTDGMGSVFELGVHGEPLRNSHYRTVLQAAPHGTFELMVHPVTSAVAMQGYTRVGAVAQAEYEWLRKGKLRELAESMGFRLQTYRDLPA
jgi:predicted glycoside hydrolase/deacetylase ChbG (UPF0249 family)